MYFIPESVSSEIVTMPEAIACMEAMFADFARGQSCVFPVVLGQGPDPDTRFSVKSGLMRADRTAGLKVGSYWPGNRAKGLKAHASTTLLLDPDTPASPKLGWGEHEPFLVGTTA